jgi:hypothetical protein
LYNLQNRKKNTKKWGFSSVATQYAINVQLKYLIHMFCLWISSHKLYKEGVFYSVFTLKYMCNWDEFWKV